MGAFMDVKWSEARRAKACDRTLLQSRRLTSTSYRTFYAVQGVNVGIGVEYQDHVDDEKERSLSV